jgi:hypothetical protein
MRHRQLMGIIVWSIYCCVYYGTCLDITWLVLILIMTCIVCKIEYASICKVIHGIVGIRW